MTWIKHVNPAKDSENKSSAAYNFIELPNKVVQGVENADDLPNHDSFSNSKYKNTGHFDITLTTKTPLYIRCPLTPQECDEKVRQEEQIKQGESFNYEDKSGNKAEFFYTNKWNKEKSATIPGSSLRGMLRNLIEIVSYGKISFVQNHNKIFFREVAAPTNDSLGNYYKEKIKHIKTGYLKKSKEGWKISSAKKPKDIWEISENKPYLSIKDDFANGKVSNFLDYNQPNYQPQIHKITFDASVETSTDGDGKERNYLSISNIADENKKLKYKGVLVCPGNMLENDNMGTDSPIEKCSIILEKTDEKIEINIPQQVVSDYKDSLTPFLKEKPFSKRNGCLIDGNPVFYLEEDQEVIAFGHTPNFRMPAYSGTQQKASTPFDFVPDELKKEEQIDFAEAIFGFTKKDGSGKSKSYSSRIFVSDAKLIPDQSDIFLPTITPPILASPKPSAFQHYLVQNSDFRSNLKHYASKTPDETVIRGHKLYWHRGKIDVEDLKAESDTPNVDGNGNVNQTSKVHTQFKPVKSEISFQFKIYFENLSDVELGALCWVLNLKVENEKTYYQKLGMGKAFGMGAVHLDAVLFKDNRTLRYSKIFKGVDWQKGEEKVEEEERDCFLQSFEKEILAVIEPNKKSLSEVRRIKMLLKMLEWDESIKNEEIKQTLSLDEFKERWVLPNPLNNEDEYSTSFHNKSKSNVVVKKLVLKQPLKEV